jgi:hypothetical protein
MDVSRNMQATVFAPNIGLIRIQYYYEMVKILDLETSADVIIERLM